MQKALKLLLCFWCLILVLSGCKYQIDHSKTAMFNNIEKIKTIKEYENSSEIKDEFLKQFESYAGFSLPEYFILPESKGNFFTSVSDNGFLVLTSIIMNKEDALEILNKIKNDDDWIGFRYWSDETGNSIENIEKNKQKCTFFIKTPDKTPHHPHKFVELNFHYNESNDNYIVSMYALINREST